MAEGIRAAGHAAPIAIDNPRDLVPLLRRILRPGDTVVCLGAGTSTEWAHALPDWLGTEEPRRAGGAL
jgi:UDP-N-acetylmuramate--alanine ligase